MVLDLMASGMDGWKSAGRCAAIRCPDHYATARSDDIDKIVGLELGADDYLTKHLIRGNCWPVSSNLRRSDAENSASVI